MRASVGWMYLTKSPSCILIGNHELVEQDECTSIQTSGSSSSTAGVTECFHLSYFLFLFLFDFLPTGRQVLNCLASAAGRWPPPQPKKKKKKPKTQQAECVCVLWFFRNIYLNSPLPQKKKHTQHQNKTNNSNQ